jgi:hypothetical protein
LPLTKKAFLFGICIPSAYNRSPMIAILLMFYFHFWLFFSQPISGRDKQLMKEYGSSPHVRQTIVSGSFIDNLHLVQYLVLLVFFSDEHCILQSQIVVTDKADNNVVFTYYPIEFITFKCSSFIFLQILVYKKTNLLLPPSHMDCCQPFSRFLRT